MRIVVINRRFCGWNWSGETTAYHKVVDHNSHQVRYIVDPNSRRGLDPMEQQLAGVIEVANLDDVSAVSAAVERAIIELGGRVDRLIALTEDDIDLAARLRETHAIPGDRFADVERFRNKVVMKQRLAERGVDVPFFLPADGARRIAERFGFPVVLKPVDGAGSEGVVIANSTAELDRHLRQLRLDRYEAEQFIAGDIYHLDGFMFDNTLVFCEVFQYFNSAYAFVNGLPVGVMIVDDPHVREQLLAFAKRSLSALELANGPFHLEVFRNQAKNPIFLEVAARVGGAFVAPCVEKRWGVNLFEETLAWQTDPTYRPARLEAARPDGPLVGWIAFPVPRQGPTCVKDVRHPPVLREVIRSSLPSPGQRLDQSGCFTHAAGTFFLRGETQGELLQAIRTIANSYVVEYQAA